MTDRLFGYNAELLHSIIDTRIDDTAKSQQNKNKQHAYINSQNLTIQLIQCSQNNSHVAENCV